MRRKRNHGGKREKGRTSERFMFVILDCNSMLFGGVSVLNRLVQIYEDHAIFGTKSDKLFIYVKNRSNT